MYAQRNNMSNKTELQKDNDMVKKLDKAILTEVREYEKRDHKVYININKHT